MSSIASLCRLPLCSYACESQTTNAMCDQRAVLERRLQRLAVITIIMGDVNWHFDENHPMKTYMEIKGFHQCISRATHQGGHKIDHLYVSSSMRENFNFRILHQAVHFSDHDLIGLQYWNKDE